MGAVWTSDGDDAGLVDDLVHLGGIQERDHVRMDGVRNREAFEFAHALKRPEIALQKRPGLDLIDDHRMKMAVESADRPIAIAVGIVTIHAQQVARCR